jgi:hypothetical protein
VFGRGGVIGGSAGSTQCNANGTAYGPVPVTAEAGDHGDVAAVTGLVGLSGGVSELTLDGFEPFDSPCWRAAGLVGPACFEDDAPERPTRGSSWFNSPEIASVVGRLPIPPFSRFIVQGIRCVYGVKRP